MAESSGVSRNTLAPMGRARDTFRTMRDVNARTNVMAGSDDATKAGLERLRRLMSSGQELSADVPRGYYLNILV